MSTKHCGKKNYLFRGRHVLSRAMNVGKFQNDTQFPCGQIYALYYHSDQLVEMSLSIWFFVEKVKGQ